MAGSGEISRGADAAAGLFPGDRGAACSRRSARRSGARCAPTQVSSGCAFSDCVWAWWVGQVKWYCDALAEHSESLTKEHFVSARMARDRSIVSQLRLLSESEQCGDMHASLGRLNEVQRPACVDATTWSAWKRRDRHVLSQVLEARIDQSRDVCKGGSPALVVGFAKLEAALKACDKSGSSNCEGMGDCVDLAVEVLLWMVDACEIVANAGHAETNLASCKVRVSASAAGKSSANLYMRLQRAIELAESAIKLIELDPKHFRYQLCHETLRRLEGRATWQTREQVRASL